MTILLEKGYRDKLLMIPAIYRETKNLLGYLATLDRKLKTIVEDLVALAYNVARDTETLLRGYPRCTGAEETLLRLEEDIHRSLRKPSSGKDARLVIGGYRLATDREPVQIATKDRDIGRLAGLVEQERELFADRYPRVFGNGSGRVEVYRGANGRYASMRGPDNLARELIGVE